MKIVVLDGYTTATDDLKWDELTELCEEVDIYDWTEPNDVIERLKGAQFALTNKVRLDESSFKMLPDLRYIGIVGTGMDCIDLEAAKTYGITVTNVNAYANYSVAQLAFALMLELCYRIDRHTRSITEEKLWSRQKYNSYWLKPLIGLAGKTLGIIGMGKIGERMSIIGASFGMKIIASDVFHRDIENVTWVELDELLQTSDVVSIHCPLIESTYGLINKQTLSIMKNSAFIINTSRGQLIVEQDLADALNNGTIAGAGLDVLGNEPPSDCNPLLSAKNVILTPHIGWATVDARRALISGVAKNLRDFMNTNMQNE